LKDLHNGRLSEEDRARLVEIAREDPFVRDALDGYDAHAAHDHSSKLDLLAQRIRTKNRHPRPKLVPLSRGLVLQAVAASLVLILVTWAVFYYIEKEATPAMVTYEPQFESAPEIKEEVATSTSVDTQASADIAANESNGYDDRSTTQPVPKNVTSNASRAKTLSTPDNEVNADVRHNQDYTFTDPSPPPAAAPGEMKETAEESAARKEGVVQDADISAPRDEGYYANQMDPAMMARRVTGQVLNSFGEPASSALISIPNTNLITTTDYYGRFELFLPMPESTIDVSYGPNPDTSLIVRQGQEDLVIILPASQFPAAVEFSAATAKDQSLKVQTTPDPETSITEYLTRHSRIPLADTYHSSAKKVVLTFTITSRGKAESINIKESPEGKMYRNEALRLIRDVPYWSCSKGLYPCEREFVLYFQ
jgi:hypothetical protein